MNDLRQSPSRRGLLSTVLFFALASIAAIAGGADAPKYDECRLDSLFPAGGQAGETVAVDFFGNNGGLAEARGIIVDGPPGISVEKVENIAPAQVRAVLKISPDAKPGRRMLRVHSDRSGLTNMLYFMVGRLPEQIEAEPNHDLQTAEPITLPRIVNGRINPAADVDGFSFHARAGQQLVAVVFAHALDSHGQGKNFGLADASLRITDEEGRVVAEAQDTLGLDPLIEFRAPSDGKYTAQVQLVGFRGFPEAVYRLAIGEFPLPTSVYPVSGLPGQSVELTFNGALLPAGTKQTVTLQSEAGFPVSFVGWESPLSPGYDLPVLVRPQSAKEEIEPNNRRDQAVVVELGSAISGRFSEIGDQDWYRLRAAGGQKVCIETTAQRFLRSPVDTLVEASDGSGKSLGANDDGFPIDYMSIHDYLSPDSRLLVTAPADGELLIRVSDQAGNSGPRSTYQLSVTPAEPDFTLYQFPDNVPIWGPGSTAALIVKVERGPGGFDEDIELAVEGLPAGWSAGGSVCPGKPPLAGQFGKHRFLTITAPADAAIGTIAPFRVVGRARVGERIIERTAQPMSLYYSSDVGFFRITPVARAVVARPQGAWISTGLREITVMSGGTAEIPIQVHGNAEETSISLVLNAGLVNVGCGISAPVTVPIRDGIAKLPLTASGERLPPGSHDLIVARSWRSDIRVGMPGPCTQPIRVHVLSPSR